uniref:Uncharacterized protein n=1 Tax=Babesia bovis TaxID=5865 RepID=S6BP95_BABBO|nr:conserved hypothetical protein [Babesia bovis]
MSRFGKFIRNRCLTDPYIQLIHCKRTLRFLQLAKAGGAQMLVLGNKTQTDINIRTLTDGKDHLVTNVTPEIITDATKNYDLIVCLDPVLYARHLYNINLPCIAVCKVEELYKHRDIPDAFDYFIPIGPHTKSNLVELITTGHRK